jgi:hypothetical protein
VLNYKGMMSSKKIAHMRLHKETCYGMYDDKEPTDEELEDYFSMFIEEYGRNYHSSQAVVDKEEEIIKEKQAKEWWH